MSLPQTLNLHFFTIPTLGVALVTLMFFVLYVIWFECYKDGFDIEKAYDLFFSNLIIFTVIYFVIAYNAPYKLFIRNNQTAILMYGYFCFSLILTVIKARQWKWSTYRVFDIFSFYLFIFFMYIFGKKLTGHYNTVDLLVLLIYSLSFLSLFLFRTKILSGIVFSVLLLLSSVVGHFFYSGPNYLIFYILLITISIANLINRFRKKYMVNNISNSLLEKFKNILLSKKSRLSAEQSKLIEEDPYLTEDRSTGNSEEMDEAILEDLAKVQIEIQKKNVKDMESQVDKALGKIEQGSYGICEECGQKIDPARLEIYPEATTCMNCSRHA